MALDYDYILYVDEAGDPGLTRVQPIDPTGSSEWFILGGVLTRATNEALAVQWVRTIRTEIDARQGPSLHFRKLSERKRARACDLINGLPLRGFAVCSNKKNMRRYENPRASKIPSQEWFYNWMIRLLLERASDWCDWHSRGEFGEARKMRVIFSERGGHSYAQTGAYYHYIKTRGQAGPLYLAKRAIKWDVVDWDLMGSRLHRDVAGLQIADSIVGAFYQAVETSGSRWSPENAKRLTTVMALLNGQQRDQGVTLMPTPPWKAQLTDKQKQIFRHYGYAF